MNFHAVALTPSLKHSFVAGSLSSEAKAIGQALRRGEKAHAPQTVDVIA